MVAINHPLNPCYLDGYTQLLRAVPSPRMDTEHLSEPLDVFTSWSEIAFISMSFVVGLHTCDITQERKLELLQEYVWPKV